MVPKIFDFSFLISVFGALDKLSDSIVDYSINQNSLEQVFNSIAGDNGGERHEFLE
jgi:hypothetical protein